MKKNFNEQDSLKLINEMITQARNNFRIGMGDGIIFWGYVIAILALFEFILKCVIVPAYHAYWVWAFTVPIFAGYFWYESKKAKQAMVVTHLDKVVGYIWLAFVFSNAIFIGSIIFISYKWSTPLLFLFIKPVIMILVGLSLFITGKIYRFKPYVYGACFFWLGSILCVLLRAYFNDGDYGPIILSVSMIVGFVIPGHILNRKAKSNV